MQDRVESSHRRSLFAAALLLVASVVLSACQPIRPPVAQDTAGDRAARAIPEVLIAVDDTQFTIPADFPGGIVGVTVQNNSSKDLDISFGRLREGKSADEAKALVADVENNLVPLLTTVSMMASFNPVPAGATQTAIMDFRTGEFIVDATEHSEGLTPPGQAHIFGVFSAEQVVGTTEPQADVTVEMHDFAFVMPQEIKAGKLLWEYRNLGAQWHMQFLVKPNPDVTTDAVLAALMAEGQPSGPPPFAFVNAAGIAPIGEGERVWMEVALEPGDYVVACPIPDLAALTSGGAPVSHLAHGMHSILTVK